MKIKSKKIIMMIKPKYSSFKCAFAYVDAGYYYTLSSRTLIAKDFETFKMLTQQKKYQLFGIVDQNVSNLRNVREVFSFLGNTPGLDVDLINYLSSNQREVESTVLEMYAITHNKLCAKNSEHTLNIK